MNKDNVISLKNPLESAQDALSTILRQKGLNNYWRMPLKKSSRFFYLITIPYPINQLLWSEMGICPKGMSRQGLETSKLKFLVSATQATRVLTFPPLSFPNT